MLAALACNRESPCRLAIQSISIALEPMSAQGFATSRPPRSGAGRCCACAIALSVPALSRTRQGPGCPKAHWRDPTECRQIYWSSRHVVALAHAPTGRTWHQPTVLRTQRLDSRPRQRGSIQNKLEVILTLAGERRHALATLIRQGKGLPGNTHTGLTRYPAQGDSDVVCHHAQPDHWPCFDRRQSFGVFADNDQV